MSMRNFPEISKIILRKPCDESKRVKTSTQENQFYIYRILAIHSSYVLVLKYIYEGIYYKTIPRERFFGFHICVYIRCLGVRDASRNNSPHTLDI